MDELYELFRDYSKEFRLFEVVFKNYENKFKYSDLTVNLGPFKF